MNETDEDVSVDADGVTLRKTLNDHQFETLAVVFDIRSSRDNPAGVTVRDAIPDGVAAEDIGFHPEYGGDNWRAEGDEVVFTRTFAPGEQYTTVYGVRDFDAARDTLLGEPGLEVEGGPTDGGVGSIDELVTEGDSDMVREVIAGERDGLPGMGGDPEPAPAAASRGDDLIETADADAGMRAEEPAGADPEEALADVGVEADSADEAGWDEAADIPTAEELADEAAEPAEPVEPDEPAAADPAEAVAPTPAEEGEEPTEEADAAADEEITVAATGGVARVLAKELRAGNVSREDRRLLREELLPDEGSTDARIQRLQTQVADLAAYTDALEAFLDEEGGAEAILGELEDELDDLAGEVDGVQDSVDDVTDSVGDLSTDVESVEADVEEVDEELRAVGDVTERLDDEVAELRSSVGQIDAVERRLEHLEDDVSSIQAELEELATFRDRLSSVFGAGGMGGGSMGGDPDEEQEY